MSYIVKNTILESKFSWLGSKFSQKGQKIKVVNDQFNNPTWTKSMADVLDYVYQVILWCLHWADADYPSRYEFSKGLQVD